jgi:hypothetical protein
VNNTKARYVTEVIISLPESRYQGVTVSSNTKTPVFSFGEKGNIVLKCRMISWTLQIGECFIITGVDSIKNQWYIMLKCGEVINSEYKETVALDTTS